MILVPESISTQPKEFNGASGKIQKSRNQALHDFWVFIDVPLNFPARVETFRHLFFLIVPNLSYTRN